MDMPDDILTELICNQCNGPLSVFPIHSYDDGKIICGRCPLNLDQKARREVLYETVAKALYFPCRYKSSGCIEVLPSVKLHKHEESCYYKQSKCPTSDCEWQGLITDLEQHYLVKHVNLIIDQSNLFEVLFTKKNWRLSLLKRVINNLFLIVLEKVDLELLVNISLLKKNKACIKYNFSMTLQNEADGVILETPVKNIENIDESTKPFKFDFKKSYIDKIFKCNMSITSPHNLNKKNKTNEELNEYILKNIECPVCIEYMSAPIYQCQSGHTICEMCSQKTSACPQCRVQIIKIRNRVLEQIAENIRYPCQNEGCDCTCTFQELKEHNDLCDYAPYKCPYHNCYFKNNYSELFQHLKVGHSNTKQNQVILSKGFKTSEANVILKNNSTFIESHYFENDEVNIKVVRLGPKNEMNNFCFVVNMTSEENKIELKARCLNWNTPLPHKYMLIPLAKLYPYNINGEQFANWSYQIKIIEESC